MLGSTPPGTVFAEGPQALKSPRWGMHRRESFPKALIRQIIPIESQLFSALEGKKKKATYFSAD